MITHLNPGVAPTKVPSLSHLEAVSRSAQPGAALIQPQNIVTAVFTEDGRKVAFIARTLLDPLRAHALLEWGNRATWVADRRLAKKWGVGLVLADPSWAANQLAMQGDTAPAGLQIAFL